MICEMNETSSRYGTPIEVPKFMGPGSCAQPVPEVETPLTGRLDISYDHDIFNATACYRRNYGYVTLATASQRVIPAGTCPGPLSPISRIFLLIQVGSSPALVSRRKYTGVNLK